MENNRCNCCGGNQGNWGWGQNQGQCNYTENSKNQGHKYCCCCWEEKQECGYSKPKETSKCGNSHCKNWEKDCNCGCNSKNQGYDNYGFESSGQNSFCGW